MNNFMRKPCANKKDESNYGKEDTQRSPTKQSEKTGSQNTTVSAKHVFDVLE